jgi:sulfatase maturation enzyme AslB (radical SAM superfamily)
MKTIAAIEVDFERGPLGTRSRLRDDLLGETVLRRTLQRVLESRRLAGVHLIVDVSQEHIAREAIAGLAVRLETHSAGQPPWQAYVASARKWALDAWRGGIGGVTVFDEAFNPWVLEFLARREGADALASIPAGAALIDPKLLDDMIAHFEKVREEVRMVFTQSPPGLSGVIYSSALLANMAKAVQPPGRVMAYKPSEPHRDMVMQPCYYSVEAPVAHATGRLIVDTAEAFRRAESILQKGVGGNGQPTAGEIAEFLRQEKHSVSSLPGEVEIELTTEDSLPHTTLRPRGEAVGRRGPIDEGLFGRLVDELATRDDVRVVLGGFGDPLLHPNWPALVRRCRTAGVFGLAVRTPAVHLDEAAIEVLIENHVDILNVLLDATTAETYAKVHGADHFDRVLANLERLQAAYQRTKQPLPLLVCEMAKTHETMDEMEAFYDHWISKTGAAVITGPSAHAGRWPDRAVMRMAPPARFVCGRVFGRAMVLADGRVTACDQDFRGEHAIGSLANSSLSQLWTGDAMRAVREAELTGAHNGTPLCPDCEEWHRP